LPPKPDDTSGVNEGTSNDDVDAAVVVIKPPVPTGVDAFATDGGSGGGV
jgi:hypothetical protein